MQLKLTSPYISQSISRLKIFVLI